MENQINVGNQNTQQIGQNPTNQPSVSPIPEKPKVNYWMISTVVLILVFFGVAGLYFISTRQQPNQKSTNQLFSQTPAPTIQTNTMVNLALAFVKDNAIYTTDYNGVPDKVFEFDKEELAIPKSIYMKLSPDKNYLAYLGTSGGLDSAIKIIDIKQKKKISQDVYGSASITDFAWSPDSKKIVVAVNLKNNEKDFTTSLYLIDPFNQTGGNTLFKAENIEIIQVAWPDEQNIYYSRVAYEPEQNTAIVRYNLENKSRNLKIIKSTNEVYKDISSFTIKFLTSSDKNDMLAYVFMKEEPMRSRGTSYYLQTLSLPSLDTKPSLLNYVPPKELRWYQNYIVGIEEPYGGPDSSVVLVSIPQEKQSLSLMDMGPSGSFHSVKLLEQNGKLILIVWSEFDG
jgi:WD40 repeat protein